MICPHDLPVTNCAACRQERRDAKRQRIAANKQSGRTVSPVGAYRQRVQPGIEKAKKVVFAFDGGICVHALFERPGAEHDGTHMCHIISQSKREHVAEPFNGVCGCGRFNLEHYRGEYFMQLADLGGDRWRQQIWNAAGRSFSRDVTRHPGGWVAGAWK